MAVMLVFGNYNYLGCLGCKQPILREAANGSTFPSPSSQGRGTELVQSISPPLGEGIPILAHPPNLES